MIPDPVGSLFLTKLLDLNRIAPTSKEEKGLFLKRIHLELLKFDTKILYVCLKRIFMFEVWPLNLSTYQLSLDALPYAIYPSQGTHTLYTHEV